MRLAHLFLSVGAALALGACTQPPEKSIEKDCVRLNMMSEIPGAGEAKKSCACFAGKLKTDMSEANLKSLAKALKTSKTEDEFETNAKAEGLSDTAMMSMMGAAKSCATAS